MMIIHLQYLQDLLEQAYKVAPKKKEFVRQLDTVPGMLRHCKVDGTEVDGAQRLRAEYPNMNDAEIVTMHYRWQGKDMFTTTQYLVSFISGWEIANSQKPLYTALVFLLNNPHLFLFDCDPTKTVEAMFPDAIPALVHRA